MMWGVHQRARIRMRMWCVCVECECLFVEDLSTFCIRVQYKEKEMLSKSTSIYANSILIRLLITTIASYEYETVYLYLNGLNDKVDQTRAALVKQLFGRMQRGRGGE